MPLNCLGLYAALDEKIPYIANGVNYEHYEEIILIVLSVVYETFDTYTSIKVMIFVNSNSF